MLRVGIRETTRPKDVETDEHLDVCHRSKLAGLDASQDLLRRLVKEVVVVLDKVTVGLLSTQGQGLQLFERRRGRLLHDDVSAGLERTP